MTALDPSKQGIEAQKLISISLGKMAASRVGKGGSSLHKSLLVASVLQKARHVFLEENYYHYRGPATITPVPMHAPHVPPPPPPSSLPHDPEGENRCCTPYQYPQEQEEEFSAVPTTPPRVPLGDASNLQHQRSVSLKRRRCVSDKETQEAVSSILPKRFKCDAENQSPYEDEDQSLQNCPTDTSVSGDPAMQPSTVRNEPSECLLVPIPVTENRDVTLVCQTKDESSDTTYPDGAPRDTSPTHPNPIYCTLEPISDDEEDDDDASSMEVEHITSLVSIFSFGAPRKDLCSTQAAREDHSQFTPVALAV